MLFFFNSTTFAVLKLLRSNCRTSCPIQCEFSVLMYKWHPLYVYMFNTFFFLSPFHLKGCILFTFSPFCISFSVHSDRKSYQFVILQLIDNFKQSHIVYSNQYLSGSTIFRGCKIIGNGAVTEFLFIH